MCLYTQTLHACGHRRYTLKKSCSTYYYNPLTNAPGCGLTAGKDCLPKSCIAETIVYALITCGQDDCGYKVEEDPFLDRGVAVSMFPQAPRLGASVWGIRLPPPLLLGLRRDERMLKEEDSEMGGTCDQDVGKLEPVEAAGFYSRVEREKRRGPRGRAPAQAVVGPTRGGGVRKVRRKGKGLAGMEGREADRRVGEVKRGIEGMDRREL